MNYYQQLAVQLGTIVVSCAVSTLMLMVRLSSHYVHSERPIPGLPQEIRDR